MTTTQIFEQITNMLSQMTELQSDLLILKSQIIDWQLNHLDQQQSQDLIEELPF